MNVLVPLVTVLGLFLLGFYGAASGMDRAFGVWIPYIAITLFLGGLIWRVLGWANVPVPFRIPTTCGQQKSFDWIKQEKLDNPDTTLRVVGRMALEVLLFRSLLSNTTSEIMGKRKLVYGVALSLWLAALAFHWTLLIVLIRHIRLFTVPVPSWITFMQKAEGFHHFGEPVFYITSVVFIVALGYLLFRRLFLGQVRYISLLGDYFPLFLLLGIGLSGFWLRHLERTDIEGVKQLAVGLITFNPVVPETVANLFFAHLFLVCVLLAYFPFSKLVHMGGVFLSPTRNLANNNRVKRHINPWDYPVKVHTYAEYEDELRDKMVGAGIQVERQ
jgi:nitrate reductase gamma subunit